MLIIINSNEDSTVADYTANKHKKVFGTPLKLLYGW